MIIGVYIENYRSGGLDRVAINLINAWLSREDRFVVFCNDTHQGLSWIQSAIKRPVSFALYPSPVAMRIFYAPRAPNFFKKIWHFYYNALGCYWAMLWEIPNLRGRFKEHSLDVLIIHNGGWPAARTTRSAVIAARWAGLKKVIFVIHGMMAKPHHPAIRLQEFCVERALAFLKMTVIAVSKAVDFSLTRYSKLPRSQVIYNGIVPIAITRSLSNGKKSICSELGLSEKTFIIGMFGTLEAYRGHCLAIEALRRLILQMPDSVLLIVGTGTVEEKETILRQARAVGVTDRVFLLGYRSDVPAIMQAINVVINPLQNVDGFSLVNIEAMMMKKPVLITSTSGEPEDIVDGVTGFKLPYNPDIFAQKLAVLASNLELCQTLGEAGQRRYLENFTLERMAKNYHSLFS